MDGVHYKEMVENVDRLIQEDVILGKKIFLFGHCNATEEFIDLLHDRGFEAAAILDNNKGKQGKIYRGIEVWPPHRILEEQPSQVLVCIAARAYAAMADQLRRLGYSGQIRKLVDYNSYAEYSLSADTINRKLQRVERGSSLLHDMEREYPGYFKILCPFSALGDIYFVMSYLPHFLQKRGKTDCVIGVIGRACAEVVGLFGDYPVKVMRQEDMDEVIQAALYVGDSDTFIAHQDRPYVVNLSKALYIKKISLEQLYCCGVFGLPVSTKPYCPVRLREYGELWRVRPGKSVILSPHAKSVTSLRQEVWDQIVDYYEAKGYDCYTNVAGDEKPLSGTQPISPAISEIQSLVERAGTFIGIRSGLCDVLREASCRKTALYPDYNYCDTRWKAIDMYRIEGWENIVVGEEFEWKEN